jgi:hypothetical protein
MSLSFGGSKRYSWRGSVVAAKGSTFSATLAPATSVTQAGQ